MQFKTVLLGLTLGSTLLLGCQGPANWDLGQEVKEDARTVTVARQTWKTTREGLERQGSNRTMGGRSLGDLDNLIRNQLTDEQYSAYLAQENPEVIIDTRLTSSASESDQGAQTYLEKRAEVQWKMEQLFEETLNEPRVLEPQHLGEWAAGGDTPPPMKPSEFAFAALESGNREGLALFLQENESYPTLEVLEELYKPLTEEISEGRGSISGGSNFYTDYVVQESGANLVDGDVVLMHGSEGSINGYWTHAGMFHKATWEFTGRTAMAYGVVSAQPKADKLSDVPADLMPDRPGYACFDKLALYLRTKEVKILRPINVSTSTRTAAAGVGKSLFYDAGAPYVALHVLAQERLWLGDSSHDGTNSNTYCSKVVWTAWSKQGVNLQAFRTAGNLISPDDLGGSTENQYVEEEVWVRIAPPNPAWNGMIPVKQKRLVKPANAVTVVQRSR